MTSPVTTPVAELLTTAANSKCDVEVYTVAQDNPFCGKVVEIEPDSVTIRGCLKLSVVLIPYVVAASMIVGADIP